MFWKSTCTEGQAVCGGGVQRDKQVATGKKDSAIENVAKSLKMDPKNEHAKEELKKLKGQK